MTRRLIVAILREMDRISDADFDKLAAKIFRGRKTAAELVGEGREPP